MSFWQGSTRAMRIGFFGFCGAAAGGAIRLLSMYLDSAFLAYSGVGLAILGIGIAFWAVLFVRN